MEWKKQTIILTVVPLVFQKCKSKASFAQKKKCLLTQRVMEFCICHSDMQRAMGVLYI